MELQDRFSASEWEMLKALPFQIFGLIAMADGKLQEEEASEMSKRMMMGSVGYKDPLHKEIARKVLQSDVGELIRKSMTSSICDPREIKRILRDKLSHDEYQSFVQSLFIDALHIAKASTTGIFRKKAISKEEQKMLTSVGMFWEVDVTQLVHS